MLFTATGFRLIATLQAQNHAQFSDAALTNELNHAVNLAEHGDQEHAMALTSALLERHPEFVQALKVQGMLLENAGRSQEAALAYEKALKLAPEDPELLFQVGLDRLMTADKDGAIDLLLRGLKVSPGNGKALYFLAQAYQEKGDEDQALKAIKECLKAEPESALVWQKLGEILSNMGENATAEQWLLKAAHADPTLKRIDFDIGVASFRDGDISTAESYAAKAAEIDPNDLKVITVLAAVKLKLSNWEDAQAIFKRILSAKPDDVSSLLGVGQCELELKDYAAAADSFQRVLQLDPTRITAHAYLSRALAKLHRADEAKHEAELYQNLMEQNASGPSKQQLDYENGILNQIAQLLLENREADALRLAQSSYKASSVSAGSGYAMLGSVYLAMHRLDDAQRVLTRALDIDPKTPEANTYLGRLALLQGDPAGAERDFQLELSLYPSHSLARAEMGEVRYRQERWAEAAEFFVNSRTTVPRLLLLLCDSYFHMGKVTQADSTAEVLATYGHKAPEVMQELIDLLNRNQQSELAQRLSQDINP
jgi:tetratricopeptide (TPR) repeat protein